MKAILYIPPLAALVAGGFWLAELAASENSLARKNMILRERISMAKVSGSTDATPSTAGKTDRIRKAKPTAKNSNEWKILAEGILRENSEGMEDPRMELRLTTRLAKMSAAEILATYDKIAASDMSPESLMLLRNRFFSAASEKDPELALRHFEGLLSMNEASMRGSLDTAFRDWFHKDPATATFWFEEMIAAGKFETKRLDGQNQTLMEFTGPVIESQLASDPAAALARLKSLPESQRLEILQRNFSMIAPGTEQALADLIRLGVPENQRSDAFRTTTTRMAINQGFDRVGGFLDTIGATTEERLSLAQSTACAGLAHHARHSDPADPKALVHEMREWLARQAPLEANRISGNALAATTQSIGFEKAVALVAELHAETGSDEMLAGFLDRAAMKTHPAETMAMANQIKEAALREKVINQLTSAPGSAP